MKKTAPTPKKKKPLPFEFVFDELSDLNFHTNPMFGCYAFYIGHKIYFVARERETSPQDNGLWLAFPDEESRTNLKEKFPNLRDIAMFGSGPTGWQVLPSNSSSFETNCFEICELIRNEDPRIGKMVIKKVKKKTKKKIRSK
jgi:hypothetical protein